MLLETLANLLEYPLENWPLRLTVAKRQMLVSGPQLFPALLDFSREIEQLNLPQLQELYTQTFDLNPVCALEIGYHLFGENYKRGELLANLRETESPYDIGQKHQLPDYLPVLMRLVARLEDRELRDSLVIYCMLPALEKMVAAFGDNSNPYRVLLVIVLEMLKGEAPQRGEIETTVEAPTLCQISARADRRTRTVASGADAN